MSGDATNRPSGLESSKRKRVLRAAPFHVVAGQRCVWRGPLQCNGFSSSFLISTIVSGLWYARHSSVALRRSIWRDAGYDSAPEVMEIRKMSQSPSVSLRLVALIFVALASRPGLASSQTSSSGSSACYSHLSRAGLASSGKGWAIVDQPLNGPVLHPGTD